MNDKFEDFQQINFNCKFLLSTGHRSLCQVEPCINKMKSLDIILSVENSYNNELPKISKFNKDIQTIAYKGILNSPNKIKPSFRIGQNNPDNSKYDFFKETTNIQDFNTKLKNFSNMKGCFENYSKDVAKAFEKKDNTDISEITPTNNSLKSIVKNMNPGKCNQKKTILKSLERDVNFSLNKSKFSILKDDIENVDFEPQANELLIGGTLKESENRAQSKYLKDKLKGSIDYVKKYESTVAKKRSIHELFKFIAGKDIKNKDNVLNQKTSELSMIANSDFKLSNHVNIEGLSKILNNRYIFFIIKIDFKS